jgi:hypothetical protein
MAIACDCRAIEQDIDVTELGNGARNGFLDLGFLCDVESKGERAPTDRPNSSRKVLRFACVVIDDNAIRSFAGESCCDRFDAWVLRGGDHNYFILQAH